MANKYRGDVDLPLASGTLVLRLTLGALAEIETAFGATGLVALGERLQQGRLGARDLVALIGAAARGGGASMSDADLSQRIVAADIPACVTALANLLALTFGDEG